MYIYTYTCTLPQLYSCRKNPETTISFVISPKLIFSPHFAHPYSILSFLLLLCPLQPLQEKRNLEEAHTEPLFSPLVAPRSPLTLPRGRLFRAAEVGLDSDIVAEKHLLVRR